MVLVLYVVAGVMVVGGLAAVYSGSDIIVMERGWTMVIAGTVVAASGALLAGIATAVARLQGLESQFAHLSERLAGAQAPSLAPSFDTMMEKMSPGGPAGAPPPPPAAAPEIGQFRDLDITPEPVLSARRMPEPPAGLFVDEIPAPAREIPAPAPEAAAEAAPDVPPMTPGEPPTIVGTYNSGGNFYIMYSNGSIEAETPAGKFRFDSLDELKTFIAAGGDKAKATS